MSEIASRTQLRMSFARWAMVMVPLIILLGFMSQFLTGTGQKSHWYMMLVKPDFMPPDWLFGPVWTLLYAALGVAAAMILDARRAAGKTIALGLFATQLLFNLMWSPVFFAGHKVHFSVLLMAFMILLTFGTIFSFARIRPVAGLVLLPYLAWLCFALALDFQIDRLNPHADLGTAVVTAHIGG
ncbi:MAG: tryptophan-rich sensory protein [Alphaproteobacteria bacterium]|nr:tryptophan-rich sensory protein [Alphaproteobacteria bacterium]